MPKLALGIGIEFAIANRTRRFSMRFLNWKVERFGENARHTSCTEKMLKSNYTSTAGTLRGSWSFRRSKTTRVFAVNSRGEFEPKSD